jgi:hypothetical protein
MDEKWIAQIWMREGVYEPAMRDALRRLQLKLFRGSTGQENEAEEAAVELGMEDPVCSK